VGMGIYGLRRKFASYLRTAQMSAPTRKVVEGLGVAGYLTRGVVFCIAGAFGVDAAVSFDPQKAQGLDGSLRETAATPLGPWLLVAVALGLVIFGDLSAQPSGLRGPSASIRSSRSGRRIASPVPLAAGLDVPSAGAAIPRS
jgi:hypothetical protein